MSKHKRSLEEISYETLPKNKPICLRINLGLLSEVKKKAKSKGISYQKWIRKIIETSI